MTATSPNPRRATLVVALVTAVATALYLHAVHVPARFLSVLTGVDPEIIWDVVPNLGEHNTPLVIIAGVAVNALLWLYAMHARRNENQGL
jgi:hypothetical protein